MKKTKRMPEVNLDKELVIKPANIRIWCHDRDLGRLQQVVWRGQGARLRTEVSSQPAVKRFLEAVPHIMGTIKDTHTAVIDNDLGKLKAITGEPIPAIIFSSKDVNGLTALHKAAGLGHHDIAEYILERFPESATAVDTDGRSPLHWAALNKDDDDKMYSLLLQHGAEEGKLDNKLKSAGFYKNRPTDIDKSLLQVIPEAPRIASAVYPSSWDWNLLKSDHQILTIPNKAKKNNSPMISPSVPTSLPISIPAPVMIEEEEVQQSLKGSPEPLTPDSTLTHDLSTNNNIENLQYAEEAYFDKDKMSENETEEFEEHNEDLANNSDHHKYPDEEIAKSLVEDNHRDAKSPVEENYLDLKSNSEEHHKDTMTNIEKLHSDPEPLIEETHRDTPSPMNENEAETSPAKSPEIRRSLSRSTTKTPGSAHSHRTVVGRTPSRDRDDAVTSDFEDDDNLDHEIQNTFDADYESDDDTHKRPEVQDIDDEKGDEPDVERIKTSDNHHGSKRSTNDYDDDDVHVRGESPSEYGDSHKADTADVLDVEHLKEKHNDKGRVSQGSESTIEGVVNADPEVDSLEADQREKENSPSENGGINEDEEVQILIDTGNMEQLAALVLNGEGERLVGQMSSNPELQAFLDNVPSYMNKIKRVHLSAREGGLRELQAALDRRKFATARDRISPNGATPLHVATLFGKTPVLRYLAGRFPETLSAVDFEGRTALHYAAVLKDNGHYYGILQNIGANPKDQDENGYTPEDYLENDKYLSHKQLFKDFGAEEAMADDMLSDKVPNDKCSSRRDLEDPDLITLLGRCFRLLQDNRRLSTGGPPPSASSNQGPPTTFLGRFLTRLVFEKIKLRITKLDHNLFDVIWPAVKKLPESKNALDAVEVDFNGGIVAPDYYAYYVFEEFTMPLIKDLHCINMYSDLQKHPDSMFLPLSNKKDETDTVETSYLVINHDLDPTCKLVLAGTIECSRNLDDFQLPLNMNVGQLESVERNLTTILLSTEFAKLFDHSNLDSDEKGGIYYTMNEVLEKPSEIRAVLAASGLLIPLCDSKEIDDDQRLHGKHWPYGRGVFVTHNGDLAVWLNVQDHIRVMTSTSHRHPAEVGKAYSEISRAMMHLDARLRYKWDDKLGFLSARPSFLGNSLHFTLTITLPQLSKDPEHLKHLCTVRGLNHRETHSPEIVRVGNYQSLGLTELQTFHDYTTAVGNILQLEKDLAMQNSMHIAEMFVNIFRKKRNALVDANT